MLDEKRFTPPNIEARPSASEASRRRSYTRDVNPVNGDGMLSLEEFEENMPALPCCVRHESTRPWQVIAS